MKSQTVENKDSKLITIVVPSYNEQDVLKLFYDEVNKVIALYDETRYTFEFLFVNDGSTDSTFDIIQELSLVDHRVCYVDLSRNYGKEIALIAGLDNVSRNASACILMDADLQHPPNIIPKMIAEWEKGFKDVYAKRENRKGESISKVVFSWVYYAVLKKISENKIQKDIGDFRLLDKQVINAIRGLRETQRYNKGLFTWVGFNKKAIIYQVAQRKGGTTKWSFFKLLNLAIEGITSSSVRPLRIASVFGFVVSGFAFLWGAKVIIKTLFFGEVIQGYPSLMIVILLIGGIQLLSLGLIGEYLGRVFKETKKRPLYFLSELKRNDL